MWEDGTEDTELILFIQQNINRMHCIAHTSILTVRAVIEESLSQIAPLYQYIASVKHSGAS